MWQKADEWKTRELLSNGVKLRNEVGNDEYKHSETETKDRSHPSTIGSSIIRETTFTKPKLVWFAVYDI